MKVDILGSLDQIVHIGVSIVGTNLIFNASIVYGDNKPSKWVLLLGKTRCGRMI